MTQLARPAQPVGDHVHGQRLREVGDEVHPPARHERVEQLVHETLHAIAQLADAHGLMCCDSTPRSRA